MYDALSHIYDAQYRYYRDDLAFYRRLAEDYGSPILELGAGTGRVTRALAQTGAEVVALELSEPMLKRAQDNLAKENLSENVHFVQGDMRQLDDVDLLFDEFALIIIPFNALMHLYTLEEQDACFAGVATRLAAQGRFAFDLYCYKTQMWNVVRRENYWRDMRIEKPEAQQAQEGELFLVQCHDAAQQMIHSDNYWDYLEGQELKRQKFSLSQRYYQRYELERWLRSHGFRYYLYGDFDRSPYQESSSHFVVIAHHASVDL